MKEWIFTRSRSMANCTLCKSSLIRNWKNPRFISKNISLRSKRIKRSKVRFSTWNKLLKCLAIKSKIYRMTSYIRINVLLIIMRCNLLFTGNLYSRGIIDRAVKRYYQTHKMGGSAVSINRWGNSLLKVNSFNI